MGTIFWCVGGCWASTGCSEPEFKSVFRYLLEVIESPLPSEIPERLVMYLDTKGKFLEASSGFSRRYSARTVPVKRPGGLGIWWVVGYFGCISFTLPGFFEELVSFIIL